MFFPPHKKTKEKGERERKRKKKLPFCPYFFSRRIPSLELRESSLEIMCKENSHDRLFETARDSPKADAGIGFGKKIIEKKGEARFFFLFFFFSTLFSIHPKPQEIL